MSNTEPPDNDDPESDADADEQSDAPATRTGQQVDKYRLGRRLGAGGMAEVYEAVRTDHIHNRVALKLLHSFLAGRTDHRRRFEKEARILSELDHPGIVKIVDFGLLPSGEAFLAMEFLHGDSLADRLADTKQHRLPFDAVSHFGFQIAAALAYAHARGVVHRDLKPSNLMLVPDSAAMRGERIKIVDFGIALDAASFGDALTAAGRVVGTERYASPEQLAGRKLDGATDVYSLGLVLFESVAGQPPFSGSGSVLRAQIRNESPPSLRSLLPEVPRVLDDLVRRMLAKSPTDRPSMAQVEQELSPTASPSASVPVIHASLWSREVRLPLTRRHWTLIGLSVVAILGLAALALRSRQSNQVSPPVGTPNPPSEMASHVRKPPIVRSSMVLVPAGEFLMGSTPEQVATAIAACQKEAARCRSDQSPLPPGCPAKPLKCRDDMFEIEQPQRRVQLDAFWIDPGLVKTEDFLRFLDNTGSGLHVEPDKDTNVRRFVEIGTRRVLDLYPTRSSIQYDPKTLKFSAKPGTDHLPIEQVTWYGAALYCQALGKRLISEAQWEYLASFKDSPDKQKLLPQPVQLPAGMDEWIFDAYQAVYPDCQGVCKNPRYGAPLELRPDTADAVMRGCDPHRLASVHCRRTARAHKPVRAGALAAGFRCVAD
jgi:serine/threonine protein kinase